MTRLGLVRCGLVLLGMMVLTGTGCPSDTVSDAQALARCIDIEEAACKKAYECNPLWAQIGYGVSDPSGCRAAAETSCKADNGSGGDDPCTPKTPGSPSQGEIDACVHGINAATCNEVEAGDYPAACESLDEKYGCIEDDDSGSSGQDVPSFDPGTIHWDLGGLPDLGGGTDPGPGPTDTGGGPTDPGGSTPDVPPVTINYDTCIAAMNASCGAIVSCADSCCPLLATVAQGCQPLLTATLAMSMPPAPPAPCMP